MDMTIDEEMKLWEDRSNDEFGKILNTIKELTKDYFCAEPDEYGIFSTPISNCIAWYSLDGNRKYVYTQMKCILENWDILGNDEGVELLMVELENLI